MSYAITDDHRAFSEVARDLLAARDMGAVTLHIPFADAPPAAGGHGLAISDFGLPQVPFKVFSGTAMGHACLTPAMVKDIQASAAPAVAA